MTAVRPLPAETAAVTGGLDGGARRPRKGREGSVLWAGFTIPGSAWMVVFFLVPFYAVAAVAFGKIDPIFGTASPVWNPLQWDFTVASDTMQEVFNGPLRTVYLRTFLYVGLALAVCIVIGYPVAYYVARRAGRSKALLLVLLILPFWVNYLLRMLAWIGLLQPEGWVNDALVALGIFDVPRSWLSGNPAVVVIGLAYGYLPFFILPLYASLDRLDQNLVEAARDLGARPRQVFRRVTLPLSMPGIVAATVLTALPMFGDYYTNSLMSGSPKTEMIGNQIQFYVQNSRQPQKGAVLVLSLSLLLALLCLWYVVAAGRSRKLEPGMKLRQRFSNPWGRPRGLLITTWLYIVWTVIPVLLAVLFSFNDGRSRSTWQGFSTRWYTGPTGSVFHDDTLQLALRNTIVLALLTMLVATPLGVAMAVGLTRWKSRAATASDGIMLLPLVTPEIVSGVALFLVFTSLYTAVPLGRPAQLIGHVTFSVPFVVVVVRARLLTIGPMYEEAARDLGASRWQALRLVVLPQLWPAVFASFVLVFAMSIDDFVVSSFLSSGASSETVPMRLYSVVRGNSTPALNRLATVMLVVSMVGITLAMVAMSRGKRGDTTSALTDFATLDS